MSMDWITARKEHLGHECSCMIDRDPPDRLCSRCVLRKQQRDEDLAAEAEAAEGGDE